MPDDITSALAYTGDTPRLYLLRDRDGFHWCVYDLGEERCLSYPEDRLLNLIACHEHTPVAEVDPDVLEDAAQRVRARWLQRASVARPDEVQRIYALYLVPRNTTGEARTPFAQL